MNKSPAKLSRRTFLLAASAGTAATAAALVGDKATKPAASEDAAKAQKSGGYQLTEHVRNYYRTART
jgi:hypothetical protein